MPFVFKKTIFDGVILIQPQMFHDGRGYFLESYKRSDFGAAGINCDFRQENSSGSARGVLRGLHYQKAPHAQAKLLRVLQGAIRDVIVDIRKGSPTYGKWLQVELSAANRTMIFAPAGFAHGFLTISEFAEIQYKVDHEYCPAAEAGVAWNDPVMAIDWGIDTPILSEKDAAFPALAEADNNFVYARG